MARRAWMFLSGAAVAAAAACSLSLDGYSAGDATDAASDAAGGDALADALGDDGGTPSSAPVQITTTNAATKGSGLPMQSHLLFAAHAQTWVLFYVDSATPMSLRSKLSTDFSTWTDGAALDLPAQHGGDGRDFAFATAEAGGADVIEIAMSIHFGAADKRHLVARATLTGGTIAYGTVGQQSMTPHSDSNLDPDGPAIAIAGDGFVTDFTGWWTNNPDGGGGTGNAYAFRSSAPDVGGTFAPTWDGTSIETVDIVCNARGALVLGGSAVLALWEKGDVEPDPTNVRASRSNGTSWSNPVDVFQKSAAQDPGDWAALAVAPNDVHLVRMRLDGSLDHARFDGVKWSAGATVPAAALEVGGGIALAEGASGPLLLALAEGGKEVRGSRWDGAAWSQWSPIVPSGATRSALAATNASGKSAVLWTESSGSGFAIGAFQLR
ncbi:MAG TPA: hypothetical protein VIF62_20815 [Labilithrix sp.]